MSLDIRVGRTSCLLDATTCNSYSGHHTAFISNGTRRLRSWVWLAKFLSSPGWCHGSASCTPSAARLVCFSSFPFTLDTTIVVYTWRRGAGFVSLSPPVAGRLEVRCGGIGSLSGIVSV